MVSTLNPQNIARTFVQKAKGLWKEYGLEIYESAVAISRNENAIRLSATDPVGFEKYVFRSMVNAMRRARHKRTSTERMYVCIDGYPEEMITTEDGMNLFLDIEKHSGAGAAVLVHSRYVCNETITDLSIAHKKSRKFIRKSLKAALTLPSYV